MRLSWYLAPLFFIFLGIAACTSTDNSRTVQPGDGYESGDSLTVMSFNIRVGYGRSEWGQNPYQLRKGPEKLDPIISAIRSEDPDVVALQEVLRSGQAGRIAKALNLNYSYISHPSNKPWWGVAILSKYPIADTKIVQISRGRGNAKNSLFATIDLGGTKVVFVSIHKDTDLHDGDSFRRLRSKIREIDFPTVLMGDFNISPNDPRFDILGRDFVDSAKAVPSERARSIGTWESPYNARIDYVLVRRSEFDVLDVGVVSQEHQAASDHLAYFAEIKPRF